MICFDLRLQMTSHVVWP